MKKITNKTTNILTGKALTGFTLAEVLITLLIIGVIASLVIPNLIANTQEQELKVAWKKAYSTLDQATRRIIIDNGSLMDVPSLAQAYLPYVNYIKYCDYGITQGCFYSDPTSQLNGVPEDAWFNIPGIVFSDGTIIDVGLQTTNCDFAGYGHPLNQSVCGFMYIDVNGRKKPNVKGKDIFLVWILKDRIVPAGTRGDNYTNSCTPTSDGWGCAAKYLMQ